MYVLLGVIIVLLFYIARIVEKNGSRIDAVAKSVEKDLQSEKRVSTHNAVLGYEWHEDGWPSVREEEDSEFSFENPSPYALEDEYCGSLLIAEYKAALTAAEKKAFLKRMLKTGVSVPLAIAEEAFADRDPAVRIYAASHLDTVYKEYDWTSEEPFWDKTPKILKDFEAELASDPDPVVRAALFSNPNYPGQWAQLVWPIDEGWQEGFSKMSQLERLAAMRNPRLYRCFVVALMREKPENLRMNFQEHVALIWAAAANPHIVEGSRRTGRDHWKVYGGYNPPFEEYEQMWRLAVDRWLMDSGVDSQAVPAQVFRYVQTTPNVKLEMYRRLPEEKYSRLRRNVLESCEPMKDREILKLGWSDPDEECREIACKRTGPYVKWIGVKPEKIRPRQYSTEEEKVGVGK